jgi:hypothetical protein
MTPATATSPTPRGLARVFAWRRVRVVLLASVLLSLPMLPGWLGS